MDHYEALRCFSHLVTFVSSIAKREMDFLSIGSLAVAGAAEAETIKVSPSSPGKLFHYCRLTCARRWLILSIFSPLQISSDSSCVPL